MKTCFIQNRHNRYTGIEHDKKVTIQPYEDLGSKIPLKKEEAD